MKTVLIYSGGLDSTCLLFHLLKQGDEVRCINFQYGSKHNKAEMRSAVGTAVSHDIVINIVPMDFMGSLFKSALLTSGAAIPHGHYAEENMKATVVPFRNAIMLSIAAGYAASIGFDRVAAGIHAGDHTIYPDCRAEFFDKFKDLLQVGLWEKIGFYAPYLHADKGDVAVDGFDAGAPVFDTYSCYEGDTSHCGRCGACVERKEAFAKLFTLRGAIDKTTYKEEACE